MGHHFIAKLSEEGGPQPGRELAFLLEQAEQSPERASWFGSRRSGAGWTPAPPGFPTIGFILSIDRNSGVVDGVLARVISHHDRMPGDHTIGELYEKHEGMRSWWRVVNPRRIRLDSLDQVPGLSVARGRSALQAFRGSLSFAYWDFDFFELLTDRFDSPHNGPTRVSPQFIDSRWYDLPRFLVDDGLGDLSLKGHRISFYHIAQLLGEGSSRETLLEEFPTVPPSLIDEVIGFFQNHRSEISRYVARYTANLDRQAGVASHGLADRWRQFESRREAGRI